MATLQAPWTQIRLFQGLSEDVLDAISGRLSQQAMAEGEVLIHQGTWSGKLFIVGSGTVEIAVYSGSGETEQRTILRHLCDGECFGEMSIITGELTSAEALALTDGDVWTLSHDDFLHLMLTLPELSRNVNKILSERLQHTSLQQALKERGETILLIGVVPPFAHQLALEVARLTGGRTLLVDYNQAPDSRGEDQPSLRDLLAGKVRDELSGNGSPSSSPRLQAVSGDETKGGMANLPANLERLEGQYRHFLVALPLDHQALTPTLLTYAKRAVLFCPASSLPDFRAQLDAWPLPVREYGHVRAVVYDAPQEMEPSVRTLETLSSALGVPVQTVHSEEPGHVAAGPGPIARWLVGQRIGLALGGGSVKGWAHIGVIRALRRLGVPIDLIAGTSIGAIIGAGIAMGKSPEWLEELASSAQRRIVPVIPLYGIFANRLLARWFRELTDNQLIEDLPMQFAATAADLVEGREVILRHGPVWQAVVASAAIPGIFPPVRIGPYTLVDGAVVNPVPVNLARAMGADVVVAVDLSDPLAPTIELDADGRRLRRPPLIHRTILRSRDIAMSQMRVHVMGETSVLVKPRVQDISLRKFNEGGRFVAAGEEAVQEALPALHAHLLWLANGVGEH